MLYQHTTKEKEQEGLVSSRKLLIPTFSYCVVDGATEADIQRRIDKAFDVLFSEVMNMEQLCTAIL